MSGEKEDILQREEHSFESFYIYDKDLFVVDEAERKLVVKNLFTQKEIEYDFYDGLMPLELFKKTEESILYVGMNEKDAYKLVEYNLKRRKGKVIVVLSEGDEYYDYWSSSAYIDGYVYCNDAPGNLARVNVETVVALEQISEDMKYCTVSYCTDYIAIEVSYGRIRKLFIFDYDGNLIKDKFDIVNIRLHFFFV